MGESDLQRSLVSHCLGMIVQLNMSTTIAKQYALQSGMWLYPGESAWHFLRVGIAESEDIKLRNGKRLRGFGSVPVQVTIGSTSWNTSLFPDSKSGTYLLPVKAAIRRREGLYDGDRVSFMLRLVD